MQLSVSVTEEHIRKGVRSNSQFCPVALAIRELLPENSFVEVENQIYVELPGTFGDYLKADAPDVVVEFENRFDSDDPVEPFSFEVELS